MAIDSSNLNKYKINLNEGILESDGEEDHKNMMNALQILLTKVENEGKAHKAKSIPAPVPEVKGLKLLEVLDQIKGEEEEIKEYYKYQKAYNKFKSNEKLKDKHLLLLDKYDFKDPFIKFDMIKPKYTQYRINFLIFDDLISHQSAFKKNSKVCNLTIKCRHHHSNMLFTTQYPKAIPPVIRTNTDLWILFKFASKERIIDQIYNEVSSLLTIENFEQLYEKVLAHESLVQVG